MGIRELTDEWALYTYEAGCEALASLNLYEERLIKKLKHYLYELKRFRYKNMDGNSVLKVLSYQEVEECKGICFSDVIHQMENHADFTPVMYMAEIAKSCIEEGFTERMTIGLLARGLRSFPSFLREIDAREQLESVFHRREIPYSIIRNPEVDVAQHTDILVSVDNRDYRIWLFQNSKNGKRNTIKRLQEERRKLPKGIHILCPMDPLGENQTSKEERNGWYFYSASYIENIVDNIENIVFGEIPIYDVFIQNVDLSKEEIQIFIK